MNTAKLSLSAHCKTAKSLFVDRLFLFFSLWQPYPLKPISLFLGVHFESVAIIRVCFIYVNAHNMLV